jgi:hypothetical protein
LLVQTYTPQPNFLCRPISTIDLLPDVGEGHLAILAAKCNDWDFHAGRLDEEDLIWCATLILEHVISNGKEALERFKISRGTSPLVVVVVGLLEPVRNQS